MNRVCQIMFMFVVLALACETQQKDDLQQASKPANVIGSETLYTAYVTYVFPSIADFEKEFPGDGGLSTMFDGRPFIEHPSCVGIDKTSGQREMIVKHFGREIESEEAIAEMEAKGYRPAIPMEARDFANAHPELQRKFWIVALGAFALDGGSRCVAVLGCVAGRRLFGGYWFGAGGVRRTGSCSFASIALRSLVPWHFVPAFGLLALFDTESAVWIPVLNRAFFVPVMTRRGDCFSLRQLTEGSQ